MELSKGLKRPLISGKADEEPVPEVIPFRRRDPEPMRDEPLAA